MSQVPRLPVAAILALACATPLLAQDAPTDTPLWLGGEKYTIYVASDLQEVQQILQKLTGRTIALPTRQGPGGVESVGGDRPVLLELDDATLGEIVLAICEQTGTIVSEGYSGGKSIYLREGDSSLDPRPRADLQHYTVAITAVTISTRRSYGFHWGHPAPEAPVYEDHFTLDIKITPRSDDAALRLAGLTATLKAITNEGDVLELLPEVGGQRLAREPSPRDEHTFRTTVHLPLPPEEATLITRLEGSLTVFSQLKQTEFRLSPGSEGETFEHDGITGSVLSWKESQGSLGGSPDVALDLEFEPLPRTNYRLPMGRPMYRAVLVGKDGREVRTQGSVHTRREGHRIDLHFYQQAGREVVADHVRWTLVQRGADTTVPFVIENIPIP